MALCSCHEELIGGCVVYEGHVEARLYICSEAWIRPQPIDFVQRRLGLVVTIRHSGYVDLALRKGANIKGRHDAEVVSSTTERPVQVGLGAFGSCYDRTVCQNDFVLINIVQCPSVLCGERVGATAESFEANVLATSDSTFAMCFTY